MFNWMFCGDTKLKDVKEDGEEEQQTDEGTEEIVQVEVRLSLMMEPAGIGKFNTSEHCELCFTHFFLEMDANGDGGLTPG
jgi:hypothetical protein